MSEKEMEDYLAYNDEALKRVIECRKLILEEDRRKLDKRKQSRSESTPRRYSEER